MLALAIILLAQIGVPKNMRFYATSKFCYTGTIEYFDTADSTCISQPDLPIGFPVTFNVQDATLSAIIIALIIDLLPILFLIAFIYHLKKRSTS